MWQLCRIIILTVIFIKQVAAWDSKQLEVFDSVEEFKTNFYDLLGIKQDADIKTIKSEFRRLSLVLHPDKNPSEDADFQFRQLVAVYDVLKDSVKRAYYDEVLVNGLPNWRSAVYYYRHVRRIGLLELCILLLTFVTVAQYLVGWASYLESKYVAEHSRGKQKKVVNIPELQKPSVINTLPIQIPRFLWFVILSTPKMFTVFREYVRQKVEVVEEEEDEEFDDLPKTARKRKPAFILPEGPTFEQPVVTNSEKENGPVEETAIKKERPWTDDDLTELIQLVKRFPGGIAGRWQLIAKATNRTVVDVTHMAYNLKTHGYRSLQQDSEQLSVVKKIKKDKVKSNTEQNVNFWTQEQQQALENALIKFSKSVPDRWDRIAEVVANKTKEDCLLRYKYLVELVKQQRETKQPSNV